MSKAYEYVVAIDPGTHTGIALMRTADEQVLFWCTQTFYTAMDFVKNSFPHRQEVKIYVEVPANFMYARNEDLAGKTRDTMIFAAGGNRREALLIAEGLRRMGYEVEEVLPIRAAKWSHDQFYSIVRTYKRSSEHERDAVRLAIKYTIGDERWRKLQKELKNNSRIENW